jgi:uncharacterized protein YkwD
LRVRTVSAFLLHLDVPILGVVAGWAGVAVIALALCRAAAAGDRRAARSVSAGPRACNQDSFVPSKSVVVALAVALLAMMSSPAWAAVDRGSHGTTARTTARHVPGSCAGAELWPTPVNLSLIRAAVLCLVNRERAAEGERLLTPDTRLQHAAQAHTDNMAFKDYFEHVGPHGDTPLSRIRAAGYLLSTQIAYEVGENIGWGTLWEGTPQAVVAAWMASPGHRANILDARFRSTGIGVSTHPPLSLARGQAGAIYTQDFGGY